MTLEEKLKEAISPNVQINFNRKGLREIDGIDEAASSCAEIVREEAIKFTSWIRENYSISKGKYRHRGDFYRQCRKLKTEIELYSIFQEEQSKQQKA